MSLPSFLFNADAYTGDTPHLTVEEHGAYFLLMLAYYRMEKPLPASDRALASICKMTVEQWALCKPTLAAFFHEQDGLWRHERIETEIANRNAAVEKYRARASAGGVARAAKKLASSRPQEIQNPAESKLEFNPLSAVVLTVDKEESGDNRSLSEQVSQSNPLGAAYQELVDNGIVVPDRPELSPIDRNYHPAKAIHLACLADADASTFHLELQKFIFYQQQNGALSTDWDASFQLWWARFTAYKRDRPKPKPRVEVNNTSTEEPPAINWDWHLKRWMTNQSTWSFRTAGPEPGRPGCRVPVEIFEKFGIDPATGLKAKETSE